MGRPDQPERLIPCCTHAAPAEPLVRARSNRPLHREQFAATRREAELRRLHAVATSIAQYLEERIAAESPLAAE